MDGWWKLSFVMPFFSMKKNMKQNQRHVARCVAKICKITKNGIFIWPLVRTRSRFQSRPHTKLLSFQGDMKQTIHWKWNMVENGWKWEELPLYLQWPNVGISLVDSCEHCLFSRVVEWQGYGFIEANGQPDLFFLPSSLPKDRWNSALRKPLNPLGVCDEKNLVRFVFSLLRDGRTMNNPWDWSFSVFFTVVESQASILCGKLTSIFSTNSSHQTTAKMLFQELVESKQPLEGMEITFEAYTNEDGSAEKNNRYAGKTSL